VTVKATEVKLGDKVSVREREILVTRIDQNFLGRDNMLCLVESTDERWTCVPLPHDMDVEVL
jgi:hypothetical protein